LTHPWKFDTFRTTTFSPFVLCCVGYSGAKEEIGLGTDMQDRYFGDIGDFAKFGLLRGVIAAKPPFRLSVLWYRVPDECHTTDGRHIAYLKPTSANSNRLRVCDPVLYDKLGALVEAGKREVSVVSKSALLPCDTIYHDEPLSYRDVSWSDRKAYREHWLATAYQVSKPAAVIFVDPDNGLEVGTDRHDREGPKYTFYDDLVPFSRGGKTIVIYQHAARDGSFPKQIQRRLADLQRVLARPAKMFTAVRWRRISARAFIFALTDNHREIIQERLPGFLAGPWGAHFEQVIL